MNGFRGLGLVSALAALRPAFSTLLQGGLADGIDGEDCGDFGPKSGKGDISRIRDAFPAGQA
ncbi:MAG: hypothetical protein EOP20_07430 [Hyphomicrobiales bacterium]|nr:MAG: hypothetical protein EOP20_07430 [Hyphomicrobiales bacterium]